MRVLERGHFDRRVALGLLVGAGLFADFPTFACYTERRRRCDVLIAEPGGAGAKESNSASNLGVRSMRDALPGRSKLAAPVPVALPQDPNQSSSLLNDTLEQMRPLAAIVLDDGIPVEVLQGAANNHDAPILALAIAPASKHDSCVFYLLPETNVLANDCVETLRAAGLASGPIGIVNSSTSYLAKAIAPNLSKLTGNQVVVRNADSPGQALQEIIASDNIPTWVCVARRVDIQSLAQQIPKEKNVMFVSPWANPTQFLSTETPANLLLACYISPQRLSAYPVGKLLTSTESLETIDQTYLAEAVFAATAWQTLANAIDRTKIEEGDDDRTAQLKICNAIASVRIESSALLFPWDGLSFNSETNGVVGPRLVGLTRRNKKIMQLWPLPG